MFIVVSPVSKWKRSMASQKQGSSEGALMLLSLLISCVWSFVKC